MNEAKISRTKNRFYWQTTHT